MAVTTALVCAAGLLLLLQPSAVAKVIDFEHDAGGRPDDSSNSTVWHNGAALNASLNALQPGIFVLVILVVLTHGHLSLDFCAIGDRLVIPNKTFHLMGGYMLTALELEFLRRQYKSSMRVEIIRHHAHTLTHSQPPVHTPLTRTHSPTSLCAPTRARIIADGLKSVTIQLDGTLTYSDDLHHWPRHGDGLEAKVLDCFSMKDLTNVTFTSSGMGLMDGKGKAWWGIPGIGYLIRTENRPK